jgi:hypothetical protein
MYETGATRERLSSVRYGELQHSSSKISTKETFRSRFEDALQSGQLKMEYEVRVCIAFFAQQYFVFSLESRRSYPKLMHYNFHM